MIKCLANGVGPYMARMPGIVCNNSGHASGVARQSATIVPDNRLALPPSMAVEYSRVLLHPRALLAWRFGTLVVASFISTGALRVCRKINQLIFNEKKILISG